MRLLPKSFSSRFRGLWSTGVSPRVTLAFALLALEQQFFPILGQRLTPGRPDQVTPEDLKRGVGGISRLHGFDLLVVIAASLIVLTILVIWAIFIRKPDKERTRIYKSRPHEEETDDGKIRKRKKRKSPRREHRQRNPTLSEAGGLPPVKSGENRPLL
jgi:hypothetical protein